MGVGGKTQHNIIGTKWVLKNKQDEHGVVIRNKERLVAQGYTQVEGLDFEETCTGGKALSNSDFPCLCCPS